MLSDVDIVEAIKRVLPKEVMALSSLLRKHGHRSWIVGGSVRDVLAALNAGRQPDVAGDWDLATNARPEQVVKLFRKVIPTGLQHGTVTVVLSRQHFEVTTLRGERGHSDGRRPDEVYFVDDLHEDLARRDFTVNAMAYNIEEATFHDPFEGRKDLARGLLRAVGDASRRFEEDGLRVLRCARFSSTLEIGIEESTRAAIRPSLDTFTKVAQERVSNEWFKALSSRSPSHFLRVIRQEGLLGITAPGLWNNDVGMLPFEEALERVDSAPRDPLFRLALFVALSYAVEESFTPEGARPEAKQGARSLGTRLKLSKIEQARLLLLASYGVLPADLRLAQSKPLARRWLSQVGRNSALELLRFQHFTRCVPAKALDEVHLLLRSELDSGCPLSLRELAVGGRDLLGAGVVPNGPALGRVLPALLEAVLVDPTQNERSRLLELAETLHQEKTKGATK